VRAWLAGAATLLLAVLFLVAWSTWTQLHLPPRRYAQLAPGATAIQTGVQFRLLALRSTTSLADQYDGPTSAPPGSVWVVADLEAVRQTTQKPLCTLMLVDDQRRSWEQPSGSSRPFREKEDCVPDDAALGRPYPIERVYLVPDDAVGHLVGLAVDRFEVGALAVLTPAR
jgi:hypothetical protein